MARQHPINFGSPAIDPIFEISSIKDEGGNKNYPFLWSSSTHASLHGGSAADYIAFGEALGFMKDPRTGETSLLDVHGAGAQRSDPKSGDPSRFPKGRGPQGDVIRIYNYALCVRGGKATPITSGPEVEMPSLSSRMGPEDGDQKAGRFIKRLDKDGDGKVSKSEFDGPKNQFSSFDKNGDGYIAGDEEPSGPPGQKVGAQIGGKRRAPGRH